MQSPAASLGIILIYLPSSPHLAPILFLFPSVLPPVIVLIFPSPLLSPLGEIRQRHLAFLREKDGRTCGERGEIVYLVFSEQIRAGLSWLFDRRKFFSFPRASCIELFLPPCFSISDEGEKNVPDKSGRTRPSGSRRRWRKEFRSNGRKGNLRGNPEIDEGDEEDSGKNSRIEEERVDKERQPLFASVPSWLSPGGGGAFRGHWIAVRLRSDSVWTPSKSRVTASCKDKERSTRQRTSTSVRSRSVMVKSGGRRGEQRTSDCGPTSVGFGVDAIEK